MFSENLPCPYFHWDQFLEILGLPRPWLFAGDCLLRSGGEGMCDALPKGRCMVSNLDFQPLKISVNVDLYYPKLPYAVMLAAD